MDADRANERSRSRERERARERESERAIEREREELTERVADGECLGAHHAHLKIRSKEKDADGNTEQRDRCR